jgi:polyhydroxyalkanoate synthase subunit PhaC
MARAEKAEGQKERRMQKMQTTRLGPRPLPLHLAIQTMVWTSSYAALTPLKHGYPPWNQNPKRAAAAQALAKELANVDPEAFNKALNAEITKRLNLFATGVHDYRKLARSERLPDPPCLWEKGSARLLDFSASGKESGPPLLVIPSLVNRSYILDLSHHRSFMRHLAKQGFRPFLMDWGAPGEAERNFSLSDYILDYLGEAMDAIGAKTGRSVGVIGYCMGGLLALALAQRRPEQTAALVLMATPWDFYAMDKAKTRMLQSSAPQLDALIERLGVLPVDVLQAMFAGLDPFLTLRKFRRFAALDKRTLQARQFIILEDWLNDGMALSGAVAKECLFGWYIDNTPMKNQWCVKGSPVLPADITTPSLIITPQRDHIVPPASATPLATSIPKAQHWTINAGHIGMVAGSKAHSSLYEPLSGWLKDTLS